ncbi:MAG: hypothetical protein WCR24_07265 [Candidatus Methanomethylophilaceae archaeon]
MEGSTLETETAVNYWTWTSKISPRACKKTIFIPSDAVRMLRITMDSLLQIEIRKEFLEGVERFWVWTDAVKQRGTKFVITLPEEAVKRLGISDGDFVHTMVVRREG